MALLIYVDDIVLVSNNTSACHEFKEYLNACFSIKDFDPLKYFLGIELLVDQRGCSLASANTCLKSLMNVASQALNIVLLQWRRIINSHWLLE